MNFTLLNPYQLGLGKLLTWDIHILVNFLYHLNSNILQKAKIYGKKAADDNRSPTPALSGKVPISDMAAWLKYHRVFFSNKETFP